LIVQTKLFLDQYLAKFLGTSAKPFFWCRIFYNRNYINCFINHW